MTDKAGPGASAPPKKRTFFKKAAWQKPAAAEGARENEDMFSHSNTYEQIAAEQARQKCEDQRKKEEEQRRLHELHSHSHKRRKSNSQPDAPFPRTDAEWDSYLNDDAPSLSYRLEKLPTPDLSRPIGYETPSPPPPADESLASRYENLTRSQGPLTRNTSGLSTKKPSGMAEMHTPRGSHIDWGSPTDEDSDDIASIVPSRGAPRNTAPASSTLASQRAPPTKPGTIPPKKSLPVRDDDELEEVEDPALVALAAKARARRLKELSDPSAAYRATLSAEGDPVVCVTIFVTSQIPNTKEMMIKIRTDEKLERPRLAWCRSQGFTPEQTSETFFTWKLAKISDYAYVKRLGVRTYHSGGITLDDDDTFYTEDDPPKIHVEAWTEDLWQAAMREKAAERKPWNTVPKPAASPPQPLPQPKKVRLILKARGREDFKIAANADTTFEHLTMAYKKARGVAADASVTLVFDGDRLPVFDTVGASEVEDMDTIEVHIK
ncbi:ubiquitin-2 like Rad60 SUMO-like-domain-containing protein [Clohesyomyces aquaticus]|uniref:Ubiquitin-2 like Rad60 SUMO-like-domain-containing protein n=1 Tax=Clohesyomyces aquaticus TaxID=1231657 RepID=A0A1Y2A144_9PLEO|nr:ubiquitin-2 like Rad60 SUMO-like-domain-containing protein [Clohesyomyces aquaticus]